MQANYKVTIINHDYNYTKYTAYVSATSKTQAIAMAAGLIGGEMTRREWQRMGREPVPELLADPEVVLEKANLDEFWEKREQVFCAE